jgi:aromatic ring-opening dioxygenase LigB subunit
MNEVGKRQRVIQPKVTEYINCNAYTGDNYIVLPKETRLDEVIQITFESKCYGFARSSHNDLSGKYYIRSPDKTVDNIIYRLDNNLKTVGVTFFLLEY